MSRENAAMKARRYLAEGRLIVTTVQPGEVRAVCRGDGRLWGLGWASGTWWCDCDARTPACSHLLALRLVTAVDLIRTHPLTKDIPTP